MIMMISKTKLWIMLIPIKGKLVRNKGKMAQ